MSHIRDLFLVIEDSKILNNSIQLREIVPMYLIEVSPQFILLIDWTASFLCPDGHVFHWLDLYYIYWLSLILLIDNSLVPWQYLYQVLNHNRSDALADLENWVLNTLLCDDVFDNSKLGMILMKLKDPYQLRWFTRWASWPFVL